MTSLTPFSIGCLGMVVLLLTICARLPIGVGMILVGSAGFAVISGLEPALGLAQGVPYETFVQYSYSVVPLFLLMGQFAFKSGVSEDLYWAVNRWMGSMKGGLAMATVAACSGFAAICGSSVACAATMGVVALPEMRRFKYSDALATGAIAAGGTIGIMIPPSTVMVVYGIITEQSIGALFMAGFIPGILQAILYMTTIHLLVRRNPALGPRGAVCSSREKFQALGRVWGVLALFAVVIGGLYAGIFTPNEAAGVGAFGAFALSLLKKKMSWSTFSGSLREAVKTTGMCYLILLGAMFFGYFLAVSRVPNELATLIMDLNANSYVVLIGILLIMVVLGCFMDSMAIVLLTVPIFFPVILQLGIDPIWFGILTVKVTEMGLITPPVGLNLFVIAGAAGGDVKMQTVFRGALPFIAADIVHLCLLLLFPGISLLLPGLLM